MPVLDATFLIDLQRKDERALACLDAMVHRGERLVVPPQAAIELLAGLRDMPAGLHALAASFEMMPMGPESLLEAAALAQEAFREGIFPGWGDVHVGAAARLEGTYVVTANPRHFRALRVDHLDHRRADEPVRY